MALGVQTEPMHQLHISAPPRVVKRPLHISGQLNRNALCGAGAPADQRPGPPMRLLLLLLFSVHRFYYMAGLTGEFRSNQYIFDIFVSL